MGILRRSLALAVCFAWALPAAAADLAKIDRSLAKEPAYRNKPKYCLLVFGPDANTRVWLVRDGDTLYVDKNGNGDLTEEGERLKPEKPGEPFLQFKGIEVPDSTFAYTDVWVSASRVTKEVAAALPELKKLLDRDPEAWYYIVGATTAKRGDKETRPGISGAIKQMANGDGLGYLVFADKPQDAPVVHFNGPWTLGLQDTKQRLRVGEDRLLQIGVGTPGIGTGSFAFVFYKDTIPGDAHPIAEITYPAKEPGQERPKAKITLNQRC